MSRRSRRSSPRRLRTTGTRHLASRRVIGRLYGEVRHADLSVVQHRCRRMRTRRGRGHPADAFLLTRRATGDDRRFMTATLRERAAIVAVVVAAVAFLATIAIADGRAPWTDPFATGIRHHGGFLAGAFAVFHL